MLCKGQAGAGKGRKQGGELAYKSKRNKTRRRHQRRSTAPIPPLFTREARREARRGQGSAQRVGGRDGAGKDYASTREAGWGGRGGLPGRAGGFTPPADGLGVNPAALAKYFHAGPAREELAHLMHVSAALTPKRRQATPDNDITTVSRRVHGVVGDHLYQSRRKWAHCKHGFFQRNTQQEKQKTFRLRSSAWWSTYTNTYV